MKTLISLLLLLASYFGITISGIWAIIEFILYLVKDREFNWCSVWSIVICIVTTFILFIVTAVLATTSKTNEDKYIKTATSNFKKRLAEMAEKRNQSKINN